MRRVLIGVVAIGLPIAGWAGPGEAAAEPTTVKVRDVVFEAGDVLTVALHPSTRPIELSARRLDLEACPGTWDGKVATTSGSSWPRGDGFTECIPFTDGEVALPSAGSGGGTMHLVVAVRARAATTRPGTLTIRYEPADGFFMVGPPALAPGSRTPTIVVTPDSTTVAAGTASFNDEDTPPDRADVRLTVRQHGQRVRRAPLSEAESVWPPYRPVTPGEPVSVRAFNEGSEPIRFEIGVDVG